MTPSRSEFLTIRGLRTHVRHWGREDAPKLFMAHGWMDMSASFQFVVDALRGDWHVIAHDWRGFGLTERSGSDTYWFPDYFADLEAILDHYSPGEPVNLLGHSMGGNIVSVYAGVRPERIAKLINLEGFGLPATRPEQAPGRYAKWLDEVKAHLHETWFAWMGTCDPARPFYYRIHSPVILIEFDHQRGIALDNDEPSHNHIHTLVRTPNGNDYGRDLLRQHYEQFDHSHPHTPHRRGLE